MDIYVLTVSMETNPGGSDLLVLTPHAIQDQTPLYQCFGGYPLPSIRYTG